MSAESLVLPSKLVPELGGGEVNSEVSEWLRQEYTPLRKKNKFTSFKAHVQGVVFTLRLRRMTVTKTCSAPSDVLPFQVTFISPALDVVTLTGTCCRGTRPDESLVRTVLESRKGYAKEDEAVWRCDDPPPCSHEAVTKEDGTA